MSRISETFTDLKRSGGKGFIPFITAGDPDKQTSAEIAISLAEQGLDIIELGVPFSDPMADGPIIQRSSMRALEGGMDFAGVLEIASEIRARSNAPIVLFTYFNPLLKFGLDDLCRHSSVIDGVLLTDVIEDEARIISDRLFDSGIDLISLVAPTTTDRRLAAICSAARGFIYAVSRAGVTGARTETSDQAEVLVKRIRQFTDLPVAVGFGISTADQILDVWRYADAAVVGSAIVAEIESAAADVPRRVRDFVDALLPKFAKTGGEN
jgi:tryptophan synthase alpha chain